MARSPGRPRKVSPPPDIPEAVESTPAERRAAAAARPPRTHNGPADELILKHIRLTDMALEADRTHHGKYMAAIKAADADGVDTRALKRTAGLKRRSLPEVIAGLQRDLHYMMLRNMPVTQIELFPDSGTPDLDEITRETQEEAAQWDAEDQGFEAAKSGRGRDSHGYQAGTPQFAAWRKGWNRWHFGADNGSGAGHGAEEDARR